MYGTETHISIGRQVEDEVATLDCGPDGDFIQKIAFYQSVIRILAGTFDEGL
jgi:hypothetical protein